MADTGAYYVAPEATTPSTSSFSVGPDGYAAAAAVVERRQVAIRHSIAPRVLDNTVPTSALTSNARFSVRVAPAQQSSETPTMSSLGPPPSMRSSGYVPHSDGVAVDANAPILATFVWKDSGARVQLAGSFDDWRKHDMTYAPEIRYFVLVLELPPGEYFYRFVVDGRWRVADGDPNLREDAFGELSHHIVINSAALRDATPKRFSTAALARASISRVPAKDNDNQEASVLPKQYTAYNDDIDQSGVLYADTHEDNSEYARSFADLDIGSHSHVRIPAIEDEVPDAQEASQRLPRQRGDEFINDYDDDVHGELDLRADVDEAIVDVKEALTEEESRALLRKEARHNQARAQEMQRQAQATRSRGVRAFFARLRGKEHVRAGPNAGGEASPYKGLQEVPQAVLEGRRNRKKKRARHWFGNNDGGVLNGLFANNTHRDERPSEAPLAPPVDPYDRANRIKMAEENASDRQLLGKTLFAQGNYDAALALFSLSVKIREENGLQNAKSTAVAHTDVASAFIYLNDLRNAEKHLLQALSIFKKRAFSGGEPELGDVHCFVGVVNDMRGCLKEGEAAYREALHLYEVSNCTRTNPNYETAKLNLHDNLRRQEMDRREQEGFHGEPEYHHGDVVGDDLVGAVTHEPDQENSPGAANMGAAPQRSAEGTHAKPETTAALAAAAKFDQMHGNAPAPAPGMDPTQEGTPKRGSREHHTSPLDPSALMHTAPRLADAPPLPPELEQYRRTAEMEAVGGGAGDEGTGRPPTWKALAEVARTSMPLEPMETGAGGDGGIGATADDNDDEACGMYEEMSRGWQRDGRAHLACGEFAEAIDMYTLAIYTRKRHGPWATKPNADTHVEYARALFATKDLPGAVEALRDAIKILDDLNTSGGQYELMLGDVWGNLGCALDRLGGHALDAETAHCAGLAAYGRAGIDKTDAKWGKAWRNLCMNVRAQGEGARSIDEVWRGIDLQIRGQTPLTKIANVKIHV